MRLDTWWTRLRSVPVWWWVIGGLSLGLTLALAVDLSPWLRGDDDWRWDYIPAFSWDRVLMVGAGLILYIFIAAWAWRWGEASERRAWWVVGGAVMLAIPIQLLALTINNPDPLSVLMFRTTSPFTSGFHDIGVKVEDVGEYLRVFPQLVKDYLPHSQRRPPGLILYFAGVKRLLEARPSLTAALAQTLHRYRCEYWPLLYSSDADFAAAAGGLLTLGLNAAALWPFFAAAQPLLGRRSALAAVLLSPLIPGYVMWAGVWDQAIVLVTCLLLWLLYLALARQKHWTWPVIGVLLSFGTFITYAILPLIGFVAFCVLLEFWREPNLWQRNSAQWLLNAAGFAAGLSSLWIAYWLFFGVSFFELFRANTAPHFAMQSNYWSRLFYNPYDLALYLGFSLACLALIAMAQMTRAWFRRQTSPAHSFALAGLLMLVTLTVLNLQRAETGRVWVAYIPLIVLAAFAAKEGPAQAVGRWLVTALLVSAQLLVLLSILVGYGQDRLYPHAVSSEAIPLSVKVGEAIELAGYNLSARQARPGEQIELKLHWRALQPVSSQLVVFAHVFNPQLGLAAGFDSQPRNGQYPTNCWQTGQVITDELSLRLKPDTPPGKYELSVGMYDPAANHQRLPLLGPNVRDATVILTWLEIK